MYGPKGPNEISPFKENSEAEGIWGFTLGLLYGLGGNTIAGEYFKVWSDYLLSYLERTKHWGWFTV